MSERHDRSRLRTMQFVPRLMPVRLARSSDFPSSYLASLARPPRSVLTNQSRVQDGLFYGCGGDGLMDFEVPDAISAQTEQSRAEVRLGKTTEKLSRVETKPKQESNSSFISLPRSRSLEVAQLLPFLFPCSHLVRAATKFPPGNNFPHLNNPNSQSPRSAWERGITDANAA